MCKISDRIKEALIIRNMRQADLVAKTDIGKSSISTYISGEYEPKQRNIYKIAKALDVSESWLLGNDVPMERQPERYTLPPDIKLPSNLKPIKQIHRVPILGRIACGNPILAEENYEGYTYLPADVRADFALKCKGDSMIEANIFDGDMVFIRIQPTVENGEIAAVLIDDEATLKRINFDGTTLVLYPANSTLSPTYYTGEELENVRIIGKMQALLRMCSQ